MERSPGLVSVLIPAYRADEFLPATLERVARQSYPHWEVIVVEDASLGGTEQLVAEFACRVPGNRVVYRRHEQNLGQGPARNTALSEARGEYVALLDADDLWVSDHLGAAVDTLLRTGSDVAYSTSVTFDTHSGHLLYLWGPTARDLADFPHGLYARNFITPSTVVLRRSVFDRVGAFDTSRDLQGCEDIDFWLRCVSARVRFTCIPGCHCLYRKNHCQAATSRMDRLMVVHARVLEKHLGAPGFQARFQRQTVGRYFRIAARMNALPDPATATRLFVHAWRVSPARLDGLGCAAIVGGYGLFRVAVRLGRALAGRTSQTAKGLLYGG